MTDQLEQQLRQALKDQAMDAPQPGDLAGTARRHAHTQRTRVATAGGAALAVAAAAVSVALLGPSITGTQPVRPVAGPTSSPTPSTGPDSRNALTGGAAMAAPTSTPKAQVTPTPMTGQARQDALAAEAVYALGEQVRTVIAQHKLKGFSTMSSDLPRHAVHLWWVGPVPKQLTDLAQRSTSPTLDIAPARYTAKQIRAAQERVSTLFDDKEHPDWQLALIGSSKGGSGITASIVPPAKGAPALRPDRLGQIRQQIAELAAPVTLTDLDFHDRPVATMRTGPFPAYRSN